MLAHWYVAGARRRVHNPLRPRSARTYRQAFWRPGAQPAFVPVSPRIVAFPARQITNQWRNFMAASCIPSLVNPHHLNWNLSHIYGKHTTMQDGRWKASVSRLWDPENRPGQGVRVRASQKSRLSLVRK